MKILKGEKTATLAVEKPNTAAITVNEDMAKAIGIDVGVMKALENKN